MTPTEQQIETAARAHHATALASYQHAQHALTWDELAPESQVELISRMRAALETLPQPPEPIGYAVVWREDERDEREHIWVYGIDDLVMTLDNASHVCDRFSAPARVVALVPIEAAQ